MWSKVYNRMLQKLFFDRSRNSFQEKYQYDDDDDGEMKSEWNDSSNR